MAADTMRDMLSRRPRLLGFAALLLVIALGLFAALLLHNQSDQRRSLQERFKASAQVSAALMESVFGSSVQQSADRNRKELGGSSGVLERLEKRVKTDRLDYALVLDADGDLVAATAGARPEVRRRVLAGPDDVQQVLEGVAPYRLTGFVGPSTLEYSAAFQTATGERRVLISGFPMALISGFLGSYLSKLPDLRPQEKFVVDGDNRVLASGDGQRLGEVVAPAGDDRRVVTAPVGGTEWRVLLSRSKADLYSGIGVSAQWLIFAAFALAGAGLILMLARVSRSEAKLGIAKDELERSNGALERTNGELERTNGELLRSNAELEEFASVASHDLQEPLRKVKFFSDRLERRFADDLPEEARDHVHRMRGAADRMSTLIEDLLGFSRLTTHAKPPERTDLTAVALEVVADLDGLILATGGKVIVEKLPLVEADPLQMRQLLQNLIANALKFHRPDVSPLVQLREQPATRPGLVAFCVSDNGIGFEEEYEERIFRVFERLHPRDVYAGTGIGLALCRKIVERAGGTIHGSGRPGAGAVFTVELPAAPTTSDPSGAESPEPVLA